MDNWVASERFVLRLSSLASNHDVKLGQFLATGSYWNLYRPRVRRDSFTISRFVLLQHDSGPQFQLPEMRPPFYGRPLFLLLRPGSIPDWPILPELRLSEQNQAEMKINTLLGHHL
jgi:hypothetical protein